MVEVGVGVGVSVEVSSRLAVAVGLGSGEATALAITTVVVGTASPSTTASVVGVTVGVDSGWAQPIRRSTPTPYMNPPIWVSLIQQIIGPALEPDCRSLISTLIPDSSPASYRARRRLAHENTPTIVALTPANKIASGT